METTEDYLHHFQPNFQRNVKHYNGLPINTISPEKLRPFGCYSLPSLDILAVLRRHIDPQDTIVEIGCGLGLYAKVFSKSEFPNWIATDHPQTHTKWIHDHTPYVTPVLTEEPLALLCPNVLLTIWPEPNSTYFMRYAEQLCSGLIIIIGCPDVTGDYEMWDLFDKEFTRIECHDVCIRQCMGFKDTEMVAVWRKEVGAIEDRHEWNRLQNRDED